MPITSINFSTSQENINKIGLRSWKKFGAEYQLIEGENLETAKKVLKDFVYESLKKQPEELPDEKTININDAPYGITETSNPQSTEAKIIAQIYDCSDLKVLESFKLLSGKYPAVKAAYEQQLKKLSK